MIDSTNGQNIFFKRSHQFIILEFISLHLSSRSLNLLMPANIYTR